MLRMLRTAVRRRANAEDERAAKVVPPARRGLSSVKRYRSAANRATEEAEGLAHTGRFRS